MKELNIVEIETMLLQAEALIREEKVPDAKEVLLQILAEEPGCGRAHNHLGWIYTHVLTNYVKAEFHLKLALKFVEGYPASVTNYAIFLLEANRKDDLLIFISECESETYVDTALLLVLKGNVLETKRKYNEALKCYKESKAQALNEEFLYSVNGHIARVSLKMNKLQRVMAAF